MKWFGYISATLYTIASISFIGISLAMVIYSLLDVFHAMQSNQGVINQLLHSVGLIVVAMAVFDVAKYLLEEEVLRKRELRSMSEARHTLTKFMTIITIAVSLEALVFIFNAGTQQMENLIYPSLLLISAVAVIVGMGVYQRLSVQAAERAKK